MPWFNTSKMQQDTYYKQDEYRRLCEKAEKGDAKTVLRAGRHEGEEKVSISLDSLTPLPRCPQCGAKEKAAQRSAESAVISIKK